MALSALFVAGIAFIIFNLPSSSQISEFFKKKLPTVNQTVPQNQEGSTQVVAPQESLSETELSQPAELNNPQDAMEVQKSDDEFVRQMMDESQPISSFCSTLPYAKDEKIKITEADQILSSENPNLDKDPRAELFFPLMRSAFRLDAVKDLVTEVQKIREDNGGQLDESFMQKTAFYSKVAVAASQLYSHVGNLEHMMDRGYFHYKLNQLLSKYPQLSQDQRILSFCDKVQEEINRSSDRPVAEEKAEFERLLSELNVNPQEINYNSNYKTKLNVEVQKNSLVMSGGWFNELFDLPVPENKDRQM